jgi:hypothetical protein
LEYEGISSGTASSSQSLGLTLGEQGSWEKMRWDISLNNRYQYGDTGLLRISAVLNAAFHATFSWGHVLVAEGSIGVTSNLPAWSPSLGFRLSYGVPLDIPISRKSGTAIVRGTVFLKETGKKMAGVLLRLDGLAAVTDQKGSFTFYVQHPGTFSLHVEGGSLGADLIPAQPALLRLVVAPGSELNVDVAMTEGATVKGNVALYGPPGDAGLLGSADSSTSGDNGAATQLVRKKGLGNVLLELVDGSGSRRRLTNSNGDFVFEQMTPGTYTLRVVDALLPSYTSFEKDSFLLDLSPRDQQTIELRVVPEQRHVKMLQLDATLVLPARPEVKPGSSVSTGGTSAPTTPAPEGQPAPDTSPAPATELAPPVEVAAAPVAEIPAVTTTASPEAGSATDSAIHEPAAADSAAVEQSPPLPGEPQAAPDLPSPETPDMTSQAQEDSGEWTLEEILAALKTLQSPSLVAPAPGGVPNPADLIESPQSGTRAAALPAATAPTTTQAQTPTPTPRPIRIPLPMPTPRPPIIIPEPTPTPRPFT